MRDEQTAPMLKVVRFTTGTPGGGFQPLGEALARAYGKALPSVVLDVQEGGGSVGNVEAIQRGDADLGFAFADVTYTAFAAGLSGQNEPFDRLRGIAVLQLTPLHLVAGAHSGIESVADLHGRRVGIGPPGSGTAVTADLVMKAFDVDPASVRIEATSFSEMAERLLAGTLDALFVAGSDPLESVAITARTGSRVIPIRGPVVEALRQQYPFLRRAVIPAGTYAGHPNTIETIGVDNVLICSVGLEEEVVYRLTKALFEVLPSLSVEHRSLRLIELEQAPATPIPLHDGAARYYREREITQ
ncbi:MAG: TAXI family TRAP transporter solute-binding subunit [Acidobacteria bacterium]|nr:TAXI family TRAP transporter solute-binding subunit [Acidobacteriota bacterium]